MKWKKIVSVVLVGVMALSIAGCGGKESDTETAAGGKDKKLVVWSFSNDMKEFAERYQEKTGVKVDVVVIEPDNYPTKVQTALNGGESEADVIMGEPKMLTDFEEAGYFEDLNQDPYKAQDHADEIVDYVWKVGQDAEGIQRAISYQITPAGIYYRRDIAQKVFGTDNPDDVGKLFADYPTILQTAQKLKDAGYRIFSSDGEMNVFSGDCAWVVDGKLNVDQSRLDYMDLCIELYQKDLTAYAKQWSTPWYQAMAGEVPILTADIQSEADDSVNVWDEKQFADATKDLQKTEVFSFGLPAWGVITMRDHVKDTSGKWGICAGPAYGFDGGTYLGISSFSKNKDTAWDFVKFCTLNEDTADWWIEKSQGDTVSLKSALDKHKDDANKIYGGEQLYKFWLTQAEGIDYSKVTRYDQGLNEAWGKTISAIKTGEKDKDTAIADFYKEVKSTYSDIKVEN